MSKIIELRSQVSQLFNAIAWRYDLVNQVLSFGIDKGWRNSVSSFLPPGPYVRLLDLASGTAEQIISIYKQANQYIEAYGIDVSSEMLKNGREKLKNYPELQATLLEASALDLPFENGTFDCVTISFGIRNVTDVEKAFSEAFRVLRPGGRFIVLEFSIPENSLLARLHQLYLTKVVPSIGALFTSQKEAYTYLGETILSFPHGANFLHFFSAAGFTHSFQKKLLFGVASIYVGEKTQ